MSASAVFLMDTRGKVLISRDYRGDLPLSQADVFSRILSLEHTEPLPPVIYDGDVTYIFIEHNDLILMALTQNNVNPMITTVFLYGLVSVLTSYFNVLNVQSVQDNFVLIYELLDETMDYGWPQATDASVLKEFICIRDTFKFFEELTSTTSSQKQSPSVPKAMTQKIARNPNIQYDKNELYLDVIEKLNIVVSPTGQVVSSEINGSLLMRTQLSGIPEIKVGLNDKLRLEQRVQSLAQRTGRDPAAISSRVKGVQMEDIRFHQCVELSKFDQDRSIVFVPPDGEFELMSYRLATPVRPLILVECQIEQHHGSRIKFLIKVRSNFKKRLCATDIVIHIPVPPDSDSPIFSSSTGQTEYHPETDSIEWRIKQLPGQKEHVLRAQLGLPSITSDLTTHYIQTKPPIRVEFELPYFTVSGIQVRYLKLTERSRYVANHWVRYITKSGNYEVRF